MNDTDKNPANAATAEGWDSYWQGSGEAAAWTDEGARHPAVLEFWHDVFQTLGADHGRVVLADLASGNGAVVECALSALGAERLDATCIDRSEAAIENIGQRFPGVNGLVSDVRSIALEPGSFNAVTSQFGVEYAGAAAVREAARLLAAGGSLVLLLHHRDGVIARECAASLDAIKRTRSSGFVQKATDMFRAGFAAVRGADRGPYDDAAIRLAPALQAVEAAIADHGEAVAGFTLARLYADVARIHERLPHFDPDEVLAWLGRMDRELETYELRMSSMLESALDEDALQAYCEVLEEEGLRLRQAAPMHVKGELAPIGWVVLADRDAAGDNDGKGAAK